MASFLFRDGQLGRSAFHFQCPVHVRHWYPTDVISVQLERDISNRQIRAGGERREKPVTRRQGGLRKATLLLVCVLQQWTATWISDVGRSCLRALIELRDWLVAATFFAWGLYVASPGTGSLVVGVCMSIAAFLSEILKVRHKRT